MPGPERARAGVVTEIQRWRGLPDRSCDLRSRDVAARWQALRQAARGMSTPTMVPSSGVLLVPPLAEPIRNQGEGGFPGGAVVKNLPANAEDTGSSPGLGRSHMPRSN